ncbi:hypothetical protein NQ176_g4371 [Zarea fungicola]|uniref:Uncharacterized protein n=1 Tax=Zarea fungicola TaxID=93591 RepID=A0ACC1NDP6_9HYPO|nr:hypothetical protein NQ176_g4371 [Lecanicillium fungicola]
MWTDNSTPNAPKIRASTRVTSRELLPFCGINKVGGLESQPAFVHDDDVPDEDAVPELTMSQETVDGDFATPSRKRFYDEDEDLQELHGEFGAGSYGNARPVAIAHSRVRKSATSYRRIGQENVKVDQDFEDADFLVLDEEQDMSMMA